MEGTNARARAVNLAAAELTAVLVAVNDAGPRVLTIHGGVALPSGPFESEHRSLQHGLRAWVERQTGHPLGYVEQLYTFADRDRLGEGGQAVISISYLGLTREERTDRDDGTEWRDWYEFFPWEDQRAGMPAILTGTILPGLTAWAADAARRQRVAVAFGLEGSGWNEELVLQRYELLYEAGLVGESLRRHPGPPQALPLGRTMELDHRRILATGLARLRAKIKYRPVVFELLPPRFTLLQLQRSVEALAGRLVHKQNFRRLVEQQELVEETGAMTSETRGRPAKLFRFRQQVLAERAAAGTKLPLVRP